MNYLVLLLLPMSIGWRIGATVFDIGKPARLVTPRGALVTLTVSVLQLAGIAYLASH